MSIIAATAADDMYSDADTARDTDEGSDDVAATIPQDEPDLDPIKSFVTFVLVYLGLFLSVTPVAVALFTTIYNFTAEFALVCSFVLNLLLTPVFQFLLIHCHITFLVTITVSAMLWLFIAVMQSYGYGVTIYIDQGDDDLLL